jgi:hypothetical protein
MQQSRIAEAQAAVDPEAERAGSLVAVQEGFGLEGRVEKPRAGIAAIPGRVWVADTRTSLPSDRA